MSLSLTFKKPDLVIDSAGTVLDTTSVEAPLPQYDFISEDVVSSTETISGFSTVISYVALGILLVLLFRGSYPLLMVVEVFQTIYFHYFLVIDLPFNFS